ncbi:MAG TPA: gluconokinase [Firmicutes bacterium]|nr:gluconokinase [Bacillota bacterium]
MSYFVGIDAGTSSCRAAVFDENLHLITIHSREYPLMVSADGGAEQDPEIVVEAVSSTLAECLNQSGISREKIEAISFAGVMHGLLALDRDGQALTNAITWADLRSAEQAAALRRRVDPMEIYKRTGCPIHALYLPAKILWLKETRSEIFDSAWKICSLKDYIIFRLTGHLISDLSIGAGSGLLNIHTLTWDQEALSLAGIDEDRLPILAPTTHQVHGVKPEKASGMDFLKDTPIVIGASDGTLSNLGSGAVKPDQFAASVGTSGAIRTFATTPKLDPKARTWCYYLYDNIWVPGGATNNAGNVLRWIRDNAGLSIVEDARRNGEDPYTALSRCASEVPPGSEGLIFLTFLAGERCPNWNARSKGVLFGLNLTHTYRHLVRAAMEGVIFQLYGVFEALQEHCGSPQEIRASGGFARSREWLQIAADIFGCPLSLPSMTEATTAGAAILGMISTGHIRTIDQVKEMIPVKSVIEPRREFHELYMEIYDQYKRIYEHLEPEFVD